MGRRQELDDLFFDRVIIGLKTEINEYFDVFEALDLILETIEQLLKLAALFFDFSRKLLIVPEPGLRRFCC